MHHDTTTWTGTSTRCAACADARAAAVDAFGTRCGRDSEPAGDDTETSTSYSSHDPRNLVGAG
jgi:hypothetical protein